MLGGEDLELVAAAGRGIGLVPLRRQVGNGWQWDAGGHARSLRLGGHLSSGLSCKA